MKHRAWLRLLLAVPLLTLGLQRPTPAAACGTPDGQQAVAAADAVVIADVRSVQDVGVSDLVTVSLDYALKSNGGFTGTFFRPKDAPPLYPGGTYALALVRVGGDKFVLPACSVGWPMPKPMVSIPEDSSSVGHLMMTNILIGDGGPLYLDKPRAKLVTLLVRAAGRADEAAQRRGEAPGPDLRGHWAAGLGGWPVRGR